MADEPKLTERFERALIYTLHVHGGQRRKGTTVPYAVHLMAVAATVLEYGGDEDLAIAALLHDSAEDQGGAHRLRDVRDRFGDRVAKVVEGCSDSLADTAKGETKAPWRERKEAYVAHLGTVDKDVLWVSLAERQTSERVSGKVQPAERKDVVVLSRTRQRLSRASSGAACRRAFRNNFGAGTILMW